MWVALVAALVSTASGQAPAGVRCVGTGPAAGREFVLDRPAADGPWRLSYRDRDHPRWVRLSLEGAVPVFGESAARLRYRNANGGRQVDIEVSAPGARLDVYVDYGLDVNIDPDLDPDVDLMNTDGPLTTVTCQVTRESDAPPSRLP